jgi:hypothetical protein
VRLRVAFASDDSNLPPGPYNGFAFDNVFVGDKSRTVLVEHFTNSSSAPAVSANQTLDNLYTQQTQSKAEADFFKIQYHISVPGADPLNEANPADPSARAFFYNVVQPPVSIMDGIVGKYKIGEDSVMLNGNLAQITHELVDQRALEDPLFTIAVTPNTSPSDILRATLQFTYTDRLSNLSNPVAFHAVLIETGVNGNMNVVRKLMLGSEGVSVNRTWQYQDVQTIDVDYTLDVPVSDPSQLYIVAFVQDKITQRIHQATIVKAPEKVGIPPVGTIDNPALAEIIDLKIYPNPASKHVHFALDNVLTKDYDWQIIDQRGIAVLTGSLKHDLTLPQAVSVKDLANGVYFVKIALNDRAILYRKLVVLNSN